MTDERTHSTHVDVEAEIASVVQSVNEWDDRTSPDDYPEHLLITSEELADILRNFASAINAETEPTPVAWQPRYRQEVIDHLRTVSSNVSEYAMTVFATKDAAEGYGHGGHEVRPLYAMPTPSAHVVVPKGYALIPIEPTDEVIEAICQEHTRCHWPDDFDRTAQAIRRQDARDGYETAIKVAALATTEGSAT